MEAKDDLDVMLEKEERGLSLFEKYEDEYLCFDRVERKLSEVMDVHLFMVLGRLSPNVREIITGAEHDKVYIAGDAGWLVDAATEDEIRDLIRCGLCCDGDGLYLNA